MPPASPTRARRCLPALLIGMLLTQPGHASPDEAMALANLSLEELLDVEVTAVSRFPQRIRSTAAAVSVITRDDIRTYGYSNFGEIMNAFAGTQVSYDRIYTYFGVGGISPPFDYNARFLILIDGQRINDALYDSVSAGTDFPLDIELIEKVEFLRGPSSAVYGSNALFGVFNVITRGGSAHGFTAGTDVGSQGEQRYRMQYDHVLSSAVALRLSASHSKRDGYATEAQGSLPRIDGADGEHTNNFHFSLEGHGLRLAYIHGEREKQVPLPYYDTVVGTEDNQFRDTQGFLTLSGDFLPRPELALQGRLYYGYYDFDGRYDVAGGDGSSGINIDDAEGRWAGGEAQFRYTGFAGHSLVGGLSGQSDFRLKQANFDLDPYVSYGDMRDTSTRFGINLQDDWQASERLLLNIGARYDHVEAFSNTVSPRFGLVWTPAASQTVKLQYGQAFRTPNAYERLGIGVGNMNLRRERAAATDLLWEAFPTPALRTQLAAHYSLFKNQITLVTSPTDGIQGYENLGRSRSLSVDAEAEYRWPRGVDLRGSLTLQRARDETGNTPINSPRWIVKSHLRAPLPYGGGKAGVELLAKGSRNSTFNEVGAHAQLNLTLSEIALARGVLAKAGVYNLLDERYRDPITSLEAFGVDYSQAAGRVFRVGVEARF